MLVVEAAGAVEKQLGDAPQRLGALFRRAMLDDLFQFGKQRGGNTHYKNLRKRPVEFVRAVILRKFKGRF